MIIRHALVGIVLALATLAAVAATPDSKGPGPDAILRNLYKAHDAQKGPFSDSRNLKLAEQYFTKELAALIVKDAAKSGDEIGAIDFDPLYSSQDPEIKNFKIGAVKLDNGSAHVLVTFKDNNEARELRFDFKQQRDTTWRISDIHYPENTSLLSILRTAYPK